METEKLRLLVKAAQQDETEAFARLFLEYRRYLYATALFYLGQSEDAKDVVQDTYLQAFRSIGQLRQREFFKTWITKILINRCHSFRKKRARQQTLPLQDDAAWEEPLTASEMALWQAVNRLDDKHRMVIILRYKNDLPLQEIAEVLDLSEGTVKSRLHRGLQKLKIELEKE